MSATRSIDIERVQHPVGQGGFHSATLRVGHAALRYIYDCGSTQPTARERRVEAYLAEVYPEESIPLLLLSHLDDDHCNGVEALLASVDVETVVLPYLAPWERVELALHACHTGSLTKSRFELLADPVGWLTDRGARRVVFVLGVESDEGTGPAPERTPPPDWQVAPTELLVAGWRAPLPGELAGLPESEAACVLPPGQPIEVSAHGSVIWTLLPFTHPDSRRSGFIDHVCREHSLPRPTERLGRSRLRSLGDVLTDKKLRASLARAYTEILWADRNLSSMSLYSGPAIEGYSAMGMSSFHDRAGWLGLGDAKLTVRAREDALRKHFRRYLAEVGSVLLPHHGSKHNFGAATLCPDLPRDITYIAAAGKNEYGHPDRALARALARRGDFVRVSHREKTELVERIHVGW